MKKMAYDLRIITPEILVEYDLKDIILEYNLKDIILEYTVRKTCFKQPLKKKTKNCFSIPIIT